MSIYQSTVNHNKNEYQQYVAPVKWLFLALMIAFNIHWLLLLA